MHLGVMAIVNCCGARVRITSEVEAQLDIAFEAWHGGGCQALPFVGEARSWNEFESKSE